MATISPIQYQTTKHYPARVLHVSDHVQPGWRDSRNRVKLVFGVQMAHGREEAHIYLDCDEQWNLGVDGREFLDRLLPASPCSLDPVYLREVLAEAEVELAFGPAPAADQRQPVVDVWPPELKCPAPPERDWSRCRIEVDLVLKEIRGINRRLRWRRPLKQVPRMVRNLLLEFAWIAKKPKPPPFDSEAYRRLAARKSPRDTREVLRKAMGKLRDWLDQLDRRWSWGEALEGKPRSGYSLQIHVEVIAEERAHRTKGRTFSYDDDAIVGTCAADQMIVKKF